MRRTLAGALAGVLALALLASPASTHRARPGPLVRAAQVNETLELVNVEIDRTGMPFADRWQISETAASLDTEQYSHSHTWSIPQSIPPAGADATITTTATDKTGGRVSAKTTLFGYIDIDGGGASLEVVANADAVAGPATASESRTVRLTPRGGGPPFVTVRVQDGPDVRFNYRIAATPAPPPAPAPATPRLAPRSERPQAGVPIAYAAPRPLGVVVLGFPALGANVRAAAVDIALTRSGGRNVDDDDFTFGLEPSDDNIERAIKLCEVMWASGVKNDPVSKIVNLFSSPQGIRFARCAEVVSRILQRAEELRRRRRPPTLAAAQARRCRAQTVPLRGSRGRSSVKVTCRRTATGVRVTVRARRGGRSLPSALGSDPKLIVGRSRRAPARPGDRVNVLWRAQAG